MTAATSISTVMILSVGLDCPHTSLLHVSTELVQHQEHEKVWTPSTLLQAAATYHDGLDALKGRGFLHTGDKRARLRKDFFHTVTETGALAGLLT